jgi:hypothetical protein
VEKEFPPVHLIVGERPFNTVETCPSHVRRIACIPLFAKAKTLLHSATEIAVFSYHQISSPTLF